VPHSATAENLPPFRSRSFTIAAGKASANRLYKRRPDIRESAAAGLTRC
jgi:hypothetical protein